MVTDERIDKAEQLLSYFEAHGPDDKVFPTTPASEWWIGEAIAYLRSMLPEWSAFKEAESNE